MRTTEQRAEELRAAARVAGLEIVDAGSGVFVIAASHTGDSRTVMFSVNHEDSFMAARKYAGRGQRWRRLGYWKRAASAVRAASYYTNRPLVKRPPGKGF